LAVDDGSFLVEVVVNLAVDRRFQHLALVIDGSSEVVQLAVDFHVDLVEVPAPLGELAHLRAALAADLRGEHRAKPVPPVADGLEADVDAPLEQQVLDVAQRQRVRTYISTTSRITSGEELK
jgi:hypothetical protein